MMFDFGDANDGQKAAIQATNGPVLITAGPGTGKTYTLVKRAIYLIQECGVKPEGIFIATFTDKAAKELVTRITNELAVCGIDADINQMYIGTFHSLCLRIIKEHLSFTRLKKNFRLLDSFDQQYLIFQNINSFRNIPSVDDILPNAGAWRQAGDICSLVNKLSEEMVSANDMMMDQNCSIAALGQMLNVYSRLLVDGNFLDFSTIQIEAYHLLKDHTDILDELQSQISHIMVDEYQDTNYIQEQIVFLLAGERKNICVVGDDDQGLYRFRGATIRNILEFPQKFPNGKCKIIQLVVNYRSNSDIVNFYNDWMSTTKGNDFEFEWGKYRYDKKIIPHQQTILHSPAVVKLSASNDVDKWHHKILDFINGLMKSGKIDDYNQIAFLFSSVKNKKVIELAEFLEQNHINVYSPRSDMFFKREEVELTIGCLMLLFPEYVKKLSCHQYIYLQDYHYRYYATCINMAASCISNPSHSDLKKWMAHLRKQHSDLHGTTDYAYCGLLYQMFQFEPFSSILDMDMNGGVVDIRPARNLAKMTQIIGKFEYIQRINVLDGKKFNGVRSIDRDTELLFNIFMKMLLDGGITEYEDDSEYAPSGCVSFMTIHQSKGMEFPIVIVDSLSNLPRKRYTDLMVNVEERYFHRPVYEPYKVMKFFDFWRLYCTKSLARRQTLVS